MNHSFFMSLRGRLFLAVMFCFLACGSASAQPSLSDVQPRGLQIGGTTRLQITGNGFGDSPSLLLPQEVGQTLVKSEGNLAVFDVTVEKGSMVGLVPLRVANASGVSNRALISIDGCREVTSLAEAETLPVAWTARVSGDQRPRLTFEASAGQGILVDLEGKRLGSNFQPVIRVYDAKNSQVAWSGPKAILAGDARVWFEAPQDGKYSVEVHDVLYRAPGNSLFRVKVGELVAMDVAIPFAAQRGQTYAGALGSFDVNVAATLVGAAFGDVYDGWVPFPVMGDESAVGPAPRIWVSQSAEMREEEHEPNQPQSVGPAPIGIQGQLDENENVDKYVIDVQPGRRYRCELWAHRLGSSVDGILVVRGANNRELGRNDDRPGTSDPLVDVNVPGDTTQLIVEVYDINRDGGENYDYRLAIDDLTNGGFAVTLPVEQLHIPLGGSTLLELPIARNGVSQPLEIELPDLPAGIQVSGTHVPPSSDRAVLTFTSQDNASSFGLAQIGCRVKDSTVHANFATRPLGQPYLKMMPWLARDFAVATSRPSPIAVRFDTPDNEVMAWNGGQFSIPFELTRSEGSAGVIRVRLVTTQSMPKKTVKVDNKDQVVDDLEKAIRLKAPIELGPDSLSATAEVLVPSGLAPDQWGFALVAELLNDDKSQVIASATTSTMYFAAARPFTVQVNDLANPIAATAGETLTLTGTITRVDSFTEAVTLQMTGLPEGYSSEPVTLDSETSEFTISILIPENANGDVGGIQLTSKSSSDDASISLGQAPNITLTLKVAPKANP